MVSVFAVLVERPHLFAYSKYYYCPCDEFNGRVQHTADEFTL